MQALSLAVHIPLVCFGIAFPALVLFVESLYLRTGDPLYRTLAMRWSKVMITLFAVGVVTGTILSFEFGLLWPGVHGGVRERLRPRLRVRGLLVLPRGDLHRDLRLRLGPHLAAQAPRLRRRRRDHRHHRLADGDRGQRLDEPPDRLQARRTARPSTCIRGRRCSATRTSGTSSCTCTSPATSSPASWSRPSTRGARCAGAGAATSGPRSRSRSRPPRSRRRCRSIVGDWVAARRRPRSSRSSSPRSRASARRPKGAPIHLLGWYDGEEVRFGIAIPRLLSLLAFHDPNATVRGARRGAAAGPAADSAVNVTRFAFQTMVGIGTALALLGVRLRLRAHPQEAAARVALVLPGGRRCRAGVGRRADRRLGHDRGRPPAVGRLPRDAHLRGGDGRRAASRSATRRSSSSTPRSRSPSGGCCGGSPRAARPIEAPSVLAPADVADACR